MTHPAEEYSGPPALPTIAPSESAVAAARAAKRTARSVPTQRAGRRAAVAAPLGSITTAAVRTTAGTSTCSACASTALTHLQLTLTNGTPVVFVSCHDCERTGWFAADDIGTMLSFEAVLAGATKAT
jgi:hypothetical protein